MNQNQSGGSADNVCEAKKFELSDYAKGTPRWCKGCGDFSILTAIQKVFRNEQVAPEKVIAVSGIGCSSRLPHYLNTYGFHGIHGRALTISTGIELMRPDLSILTIMGDGDCYSIGGNHWLHAIRNNIHATVLVLDNAIYALTKKQVSPTTPKGGFSNTTPRGSYLEALNPLSVVMGITNVSFLAQTATWLPGHLENTITKAWRHRGLSFVRILQRCPVHVPSEFHGGGPNFPALFLEHEEGIEVDRGILRSAPIVKHNPFSLSDAQQMALRADDNPMGLLYWNPSLPSYGETRRSNCHKVSAEELISKLNKRLDQYTIKTGSPTNTIEYKSTETEVPKSTNALSQPQAANKSIAELPWIESELCTACNECILTNDQIFAYNDEKEAYVKNPKIGPFKDIVKAAEKCPAQIIHPGKPQDLSENDLPQWIVRAHKYQ